MSRNILPMAILAGSLLMSPIAVSEVYYKWVDAQGQVHYSDQQPQAGVEKVEVIDIPGVPAESSQTLVPDQSLKTIKALAQELAQRLKGGAGQDLKRARELAQELVQQLETSTEQGLGRIRELARELMRQLEADTEREPERIPKMARNLVREIKAYEAATLTPPSSPEQDLEKIRKLTREWEAERQALEEQRRQESLANQNEEQPVPAGQQITPSWWWPIIDNPCFQYPWGCPPPLPPYYPPLSPLPLVRPHPPLLHPPLVRPHPPLLHPPLVHPPLSHPHPPLLHPLLSHPLLVRPHPSLSHPYPPLSHPPPSHPLPEQPKP